MNPGGAGASAWEGVIPDVAQAAARVAECGWAPGGAGNLSLRLPGVALEQIPFAVQQLLSPCYPSPELANQWLLVSLAGAEMAQLAADPLAYTSACRIGLGGRILVTRPPLPAVRHWRLTSELAAHLAVQQCLVQHGRREGAILHAHLPGLARVNQPYAQADRTELNTALHETCPTFTAAFPRGIGIATGEPGTVELGQRTAAAAAETRVVVWPGHGALAWAATLQQAVELLEIAELAAQAVLHRLGISVGPAPQDAA